MSKAAKKRLERIEEVRECLEKDHGLVGVRDISIEICLGVVPAKDPKLSIIQSAAELYDQNHRIKLDERDWPGRRISSLGWYQPPRKKTARKVSFSPQTKNAASSAYAGAAAFSGDEENVENGATVDSLTDDDDDEESTAAVGTATATTNTTNTTAAVGTDRVGPPQHARDSNVGTILPGKDGKLWIVKTTKQGTTHRWCRHNEEPISISLGYTLSKAPPSVVKCIKDAFNSYNARPVARQCAGAT